MGFKPIAIMLLLKVENVFDRVLKLLSCNNQAFTPQHYSPLMHH